MSQLERKREFPAFERQLLAYLPQVVQDVDEMQQIMAAEQPELVELWEAVQRVLDEQFIETMSDYGVRRWEKILQIVPNPNDSLESRKERIYAALRARIPYTLRWLQGWLLESFGENNFKLGIDRYTITVDLYVSRWGEDSPLHTVHFDILDFLVWIKPANMLLKIISVIEASSTLYLNTAACETVDLTLGPVSVPRVSTQTLYLNCAACETVEITLRPAPKKEES